MCAECEADRFTDDELATAAMIEPISSRYRAAVLRAAIHIVQRDTRLTHRQMAARLDLCLSVVDKRASHCSNPDHGEIHRRAFDSWITRLAQLRSEAQAKR